MEQVQQNVDALTAQMQNLLILVAMMMSQWLTITIGHMI